MSTRKRICTAFAVGALVVGVATRADARSITIKQNLSATGVDADAMGRVQAQISSPKSGMRGKLDVTVRRLDPGATYTVLLNGVPIGTVTTTAGGSGRARFSSQPRRKDQLLGTDPRGTQIEVRNGNGDDVLDTTVPNGGTDPTNVRCCIPHSGDSNEQPECEDTAPAACTAAGGVDSGASSCLPNPCEGATPPPPQDSVVCCTPEDNGAECEMRSTAKCSDHGGVNLGAGTCDPNPCTATPPTNPETVQCCVTDEEETECKQRTAERCTAHGGANMGAGSCSPNPCTSTPPVDQVICCLPHDSGGSECEQQSAAQCTAHGGTSMGTGSCDPNPCAATPPADQIQCCVTTNAGGIECVQQTASRCMERGGTNVGLGTCDPTACANVTPVATIRCCLPHGGEDGGGSECEHGTDQQCTAHGGTNIGAGSCDPNPCP